MADEISEAIANPDTFVDQKVYDDLFKWLRREEPVRWTTPTGTRPFWLLSKHHDIIEIERRPELFLNAPRNELLTIAEEERIKAATGGAHHLRTMLHMDGAEHRSYRGLSQSWFMPANLRKLEIGLAELAKEYVDRLEQRGGECDFVNDVAVWYPLRVIMTILGLPPEEAPELLRLTRNFVGRKDESVLGDNPLEGGVDAAREIFDYFTDVYHDRLKTPRDDLASVIANAKIGNEPIGQLEALSYYQLIGLAGHETTSATIAGGLLALIENPAEMANLREDPSQLSSATDEMLRWVCPVKHFFRTATGNYTLRGQSIKPGDSLMICFPSANRDEDVFEDPFSFKVDRSPNPQLSLGHGAHHCLGQHLAKMEIRALFQELIPRLHRIELAGQPALLATTFAGGLKYLPIRYQMRAAVS